MVDSGFLVGYHHTTAKPSRKPCPNHEDHAMKTSHRRPSRRQFLKTASAAAMPLIVPVSAFGQAGRPPASERIVMATIGTGGQGTGDMSGFMSFPEVQMVAVCDPV